VSVVAFKAKNHPQQAATDSVDDRWTPDYVFAPLTAEHGFTLDVCASISNAKCSRFFTAEEDGLVQSWAREVVWCNPPYSNIGAWVKKALTEVRSGGCPKVVMLLPANRTEQGWWQDLIEPVRDLPGSGVATRHLRGRINFGKPGNPTGKYNSSCPFGSVLLILTRRGAP